METYDILIDSVVTFLHAIREKPSLGGGHCVYRGQSNSEWPLLPKAGRPPFCVGLVDPLHPSVKAHDLWKFEEWMDKAIAFSNCLPGSFLEGLALAQHYGLATRLMDWSANPLVALYFACEAEPTEDGAVFGYANRRPRISNSEDADSITEVSIYHPRPIDRRIVAQSGMFSYHPIPHEVFSSREHESLIRYVIMGGRKDLILDNLSDLGISRITLFPDLEGLSFHLNRDTRGVYQFMTRSKTRPKKEAL